MGPVLFGDSDSPRDELLLRGVKVYAASKGNFKAHYIIEGAYRQFEDREVLETPMLFNSEEDPGEKYDVAEELPEVLAEIEAMVQTQ